PNRPEPIKLVAPKPPVASLSCSYVILGYLTSFAPSSTSSKSPLLTVANRFFTLDFITVGYLKSMHRRGVPNSDTGINKNTK
ncbi:hypothetical protein VIGAN_01411600, partial [Vigna angularis var. angularis]